MPTRPTASGAVSRRRSNASTPRTTFFDGSVRSTRSTTRSGRPSSSRRSASSTGGLDASSSNSCGSIEIGCAATVVRVSASGPSTSVADSRKAPAQRSVWKATTSFATSPAWIAARTGSGSTRQRSGGGHGMCVKCAEQRVGPLVANEERRHVEVVVVEEDGRVRALGELLEHGLGERAVDRDVAVLPGAPELVAPVLEQPPQVVLEEPERRIRDDVVVAVVRRRVVHHEPKPAARPVTERLLEGASGGDRDGAVLLADRARDPRDVVVRDEAAKRGHEPAPAPAGDSRPILAAGVSDRAAVGDDDQPAPRRHARRVCPTRPRAPRSSAATRRCRGRGARRRARASRAGGAA